MWLLFSGPVTLPSLREVHRTDVVCQQWPDWQEVICCWFQHVASGIRQVWAGIPASPLVNVMDLGLLSTPLGQGQ